MRILIVSEQISSSGASLAAQRLFSTIGQRREASASFLFFSGTPQLLPPGQTTRAYPDILNSRPFRLMTRLGVRFDKLKRRAVLKKIAEIHPDIVNLHNVSGLLHHSDILRISDKIPVIWTLHDQFGVSQYNYQFQDCSGNSITKTQRIAVPEEASYLDAVLRNTAIRFISCSNWLRGHAIAQGVSPGRVSTIYNGVETPSSTAEILALKKSNRGKLKIAFIAGSNQSERKNWGIVRRSADHFRNDDRVEFVWVGGPPQENAKNVRCLPTISGIDKMHRLYLESDLVLIPSLLDNLPNVISESFAAGTPVLGSTRGGIPEMIDDSTGWLFDPCDDEQLRRLIRAIVEQRSDLWKMAQACINKCKHQFSAEAQRLAYLDFFRGSL